VRERDEIEAKTIVHDDEAAADDGVEFVEDDELGNGEFTDWNNESWAQNFQFVVHPGGTIRDLLRIGHTIRATDCLSRKTTDDGGEVNSRTHSRLIYSAPFLKPAEQCFAGGMREGTFENRFADAGRLADDHDVADDRAACDRRWNDARATAALPQSRDMFA
jgi:hypothetical protein